MSLLSDILEKEGGLLSDALRKPKSEPLTLADYDDYPAFRKRIFEKAQEAVQSTFPYGNEQYSLRVDNLAYVDPEHYSKKHQKDVILKGGDLTRRLAGSVSVVENATGKVVSKAPRKTLIAVPYLTERGTFIRQGTEYAFAKQMRLRPSVYSRFTTDGFYESQFNIRPRTGTPFRVHMDPESSVFYMKLGGRKMSLYPILQGMGVTDEEIAKSWGQGVLDANKKQKPSPHTFHWMNSIKVGKPLSENTVSLEKEATPTSDAETQNLRDFFIKMELDPQATARTLGHPYDRVSDKSILSATEKLLDMSRGTAEADDRDSLAYQTAHDYADFLRDKIVNDQSGVLRKHMWKITGKQGNLEYLPPGALNQHVTSLYNNSGLAQAAEEINPADMYTLNQKITRLGEGAMSNVEAAPKESHNLQPSQYGFIDPVKSPECFQEGTEVYTEDGWRDWRDVNLSTKFAGLLKGQLVFVKATDLHRKFYIGEMYGYRNSGLNYVVTPNHRMWSGTGYADETFDYVLSADIYGKQTYARVGIRDYEQQLVVELQPDKHYKIDYEGMVYCATVPGSVLLTRYDKGLPFWSGNSQKIGLDVFFSRGVRKGSDNLLYRQFVNPHTGKKEWVDSRTASDSIIAFPGSFDPKKKFVPAMVKSKGIFYVPREDVQYTLENGDDMFSTSSDTVPLKSGVKGMRLLMGAKFLQAALPLTHRESPYLQTLGYDGDPVMKHLGKFSGAIKSEQPGIVQKVTKDEIFVKNADGTVKEYELYNDFPLARKTTIYSTPKVQPGDKIGKGHLLASSNFSDDKGDLAPGTNLRIAYMPYKGQLFEDSHTISESASKKLTSEFLYREDIDKDDDLEIGVKKFRGLFPGKFTKDQLDTVDATGIVKPGTVLNYGDPMVLAVKEREPSLSSLGRRMTTDASISWKHKNPGVVTDIAKSKTGYIVYVRSESPMQVGDKLAISFGGKGIVGCYDSETEILTTEGWVRLEDLKEDMSVAYLNDDGSADFAVPKSIIHAPYTGTMYGYSNDCLDYLVTPNHRKWCRPEDYKRKSNWTGSQSRMLNAAAEKIEEFGVGALDTFEAYLKVCGRRSRKGQLWEGVTKCFGNFDTFRSAVLDIQEHGNEVVDEMIVPKYRARDAAEVHGTSCLHRVAANFIGKEHRTRSITVPYPQTTAGRTCVDTFDSVDFYTFMGWYLSEGHARIERYTDVGKEKSQVTAYLVDISQSPTANPVKCAELELLFARMGLKWTKTAKGNAYRIKNRVLCLYLKEFGLAYQKYVPRWMLEEGSTVELEAMVNAYNKGDGHFCGSWATATSTSRKLADTMQEAALLAGYTAIVKGPFNRSEPNHRPRWRVTFKKDRFEGCSYGDNYLIKEYSGNVHCVEMGKGPGVVCVRRAGAVMWSGNSILPDSQMPRDAQGRPVDVLMNPFSIASRTNSAQMVAAALGKVAEKTGKRYVLPGFMEENLAELALKELSQNGLTDTEEVYDPTTEKKIPEVFTGNLYFYKQQQTAESKGHSRSTGGYTAEGTPSRNEEGKCFPGQQRVLTLRGEKRISHLVEKRLSEYVWSYNETLQAWGYYPITNWFTRRANVSELLRVEVEGAASVCGGKAIKHCSCLYPTVNHQIYLYDGSKVPAGQLKPGDVLVTWGPRPTQDQLSLVYGSMLGDAYLCHRGIQIMHSVKQTPYNRFKQSVLAGLGATAANIKSKGTAPNGKSHNRDLLSLYNKEVRRLVVDLCYENGKKKKVTKKWLDSIGDLGLCVWILDDGSICNRAHKEGGENWQGTLATHGFSKEETELICEWLNARLGTTGIHPAPVKGYDYFLTYLCAEACRKLVDLIAENIPAEAIPDSKEGLKQAVAAKQLLKAPKKHESVGPLGKVPAVVKKVSPYKHPKPWITEIPVYDFTVDVTHTYTAGNVLVSNSKHLGEMEYAALLGHNATENIKDIKNIKGQANKDFWRNVKLGKTPSIPPSPFVYDKFRDLLRAGGVDLQEGEDQDRIFGMSNERAKKLTGNRKISSGKTFSAGSLKPIPGGLFDPDATGSLANGDRFAYIELPEPMLNPIMEGSIKSLAGFTEKQLSDIVEGRTPVNGKTGGEALKETLKRINLDTLIQESSRTLKEGPASKKDAAMKRLRYAVAMKKEGVRPEDFVMDRIPVLPPKYRPITRAGGMTMVNDVNHMYKGLFDAIEDFRDSQNLPASLQQQARKNLQQSYRAVIGTDDPVSAKLVQKEVGGILQSLFGKHSTKFSFVHRKLIGSDIDLAGLGVISVNPKLKLNEIGLPEKRAWELYEPFVVRNLVQKGVPATAAAKAVEEHSDMAYEALRKVVTERPVLLNRAPTLHKYSILAVWPRLVKSDTVQIPPAICKPLGADFDGDAVSYSVPVSSAAVKEAIEKMMPEKNLLGARNDKPMFLPDQEFTAGMYLATKAPTNKPVRRFATKADAMKAYKSGEIRVDDPIVISERV